VIRRVFTLTGTSPASASTALGDSVVGLLGYDRFSIEAVIIGGTGGTLDVYLQRQVTDNVWADWLHFPQVAAAATKKYAVQCGRSNDVTIREIATGTDAAHGTPVLAANTFIGGHPGNKIRAVYVAGSGTSVGAAQTIYITAWNAL
jgi:hypothetical protein